MAQRSREQQDAVAEIGELPAVVNPDRKEACRLNLKLYLQTYFPNSTGLSPFSEDHDRVIARIQTCVLEGGLFGNAVYRGFAKTTIAQNTAIWATCYGHRVYIPIFGSDQGAADRNILAIKTELESNDLLYEDFPEVCHAIRALEGKPQRCHSQTHQGELTHISWKADTIILPTIPGSLASGAIIVSRGVTAASRGMVVRSPDGRNLRPDFVIIDDFQTDESAHTVLQVSKRLDIIKRSILKLAGHNRKIAVVVNGTVIAPDDGMVQLLDPKRNPAWQGERIKMVRQWSDVHETLWLNEYAAIRNTFDRDDPEDQRRAHREATQFYVDRQAKMDAGCVVSWEHCYDHDTEVSAIQHAYNLLIDDGPDIFASECQNEPIRSREEEGRLTSTEIASRVNGFERLAFPREVEHVTAFIDVQEKALYYVVAAWSQDFTGYVIDYGTYPEQGRRYFALRDIQRTLQAAIPGTLENQWFEGLGKLCDALCFKEWARADGAKLKMGRVLIDANYGYSTKTVKRFCQVNKWGPILQATHGRGIKAGDLPIAHWPPKAGERKGHNWLIRQDAEARGLRHLIYDVNYWKSFIHNRLRLKAPARESLSLWGNDPRQHEMFADHLVAEVPVRTEGRNRTVEEWQEKPDRPDNHLFDCAVGCAVGASILGAAVGQIMPERRPNAKPNTKLSLARPDGRSFFVTDR
jgi:hypothetical protein